LIFYHAERRYVECHYAECHGAQLVSVKLPKRNQLYKS
jgi:hypothetical protein